MAIRCTVFKEVRISCRAVSVCPGGSLASGSPPGARGPPLSCPAEQCLCIVVGVFRGSLLNVLAVGSKCGLSLHQPHGRTSPLPRPDRAPAEGFVALTTAQRCGNRPGHARRCSAASRSSRRPCRASSTDLAKTKNQPNLTFTAARCDRGFGPCSQHPSERLQAHKVFLRGLGFTGFRVYGVTPRQPPVLELLGSSSWHAMLLLPSKQSLETGEPMA